jgi:hypothetical protein
MRRAAKRDANEADVIVALRSDGFNVAQISSPGIPDLLVWEPGRHFLLFEVKDDDGDLTPAQMRFWHQSVNCKRFVVRSADEARRIAWLELRAADAP